jgi:DNA-binding beta-propeller fold protein YncE
LLKTVNVGQRPRGIALSKDQQTLYIATSDDDAVIEVDANTLQVKGKLPSGEDPETFAINSQGTRMYVSNEDDNQVTVIDLSSKQAIQCTRCTISLLTTSIIIKVPSISEVTHSCCPSAVKLNALGRWC